MGHNYVQSGETYTCTRCGDSYSGHQHTYTETVTEPTCEQDGYTTYTCSCGYSYTDNVVPALGHDYVLAGQDETIWTYACTRCGLSYTVVAPIVPGPPIEEYGLRRSRVSVVTEHHEYVYASGTLLRETITTTDEEGNVAAETLDFIYDANGHPYALKHTDSTAAIQTYYYITNVQGDVVCLVTDTGTVVAEYEYDSWGRVITKTGSMADINPLGYRGYYYDAESGLYYLQSRCYDPVTCRFINADSYVSTGQDFLGYNMFVYCGNNPANNIDPGGEFFFTALGAVIGGIVGAVDAAIKGNDPMKGFEAGFVSGAIAGAGVDIAVAITVSTGGVGLAALGVVAGTGALSGIVSTGISSDWTAHPLEYTASAVVGAGCNLISFGLAPINGEIIRCSFREAFNCIAVNGVANLTENVITGMIVTAGATLITNAITNNIYTPE